MNVILSLEKRQLPVGRYFPVVAGGGAASLLWVNEHLAFAYAM